MREHVGRGEGVGAAHSAVGEEDAGIRAAVKPLTEHFGRLGQAHGEHRDGRAGMGFFQTKRQFERIEVVGIDDGRQCCAIDGTLRRHRIFAHIAGVGYLLGKYNNFQTHVVVIVD